jgi:starvation-inducible DNA-binding protein
MSTSASVRATHLPPLGGPAREEVTLMLQQELVELIDLGLVGKQLHWTVLGELFRPLHAQLDELVDSWRDLADTVLDGRQGRWVPERERVALDCDQPKSIT